MSEGIFDFQSLEWHDCCDDSACHEYNPYHHSHNFTFENNLLKVCERCSAVLRPKAQVFGHAFGKDYCEFYNSYVCDCEHRDKTILSNGSSMTTVQAFKLAKKNRENANAAIR